MKTEIIIPSNYKDETEINAMSNYDHKINPYAEKYLKENKVILGYPGWNFYGLVWFDKKFKCLIKQFCQIMEIIEGNTLKEIMQKVSYKYGYD